MNITPTEVAAKALKGSTSISVTKSSQASTTSFKEELEAAKPQEENSVETEAAPAETETTKAAETTEIKQAEETTNTTATEEQTKKETEITDEELKENNLTTLVDKNLLAATEKNVLNNLAQQIKKDKLEKKNSLNESEKTNPVEELSSKIAKLNELKHNTHQIQATISKIDVKDDYFQTINMDTQDATFFINLVQNQSVNNSGQGVQVNSSGVSFTDVKAEATQKTVQVSSTLMGALDESMKTNKPFRIDFGSDVAVIMKVNKDGVISANFIPGSSAVEAYLKNNLSSLRQSFDEQDIPYNELSYSHQQKNKEKQKENKENRDE